MLKKKEGSRSEGTRFKARLVVKGYSQVEGLDFHDVFSPVVKHTSIRILLALVVAHNLELEQLGVKKIFTRSSQKVINLRDKKVRCAY